MARNNPLPPGITENKDGAYDVRIGYNQQRFYVGTYDNIADAKRDLEGLRENIPAMWDIGGPTYIKQELKKNRDGRRRERIQEGVTYRKPKDSLRNMIRDLEQRVSALEEKFRE